MNRLFKFSKPGGKKGLPQTEPTPEPEAPVDQTEPTPKKAPKFKHR